MSTYTLYPASGMFPGYVIRNADGASIPLDQNNRDYEDYLAWVAAGNVADQPPAPTNQQTEQQLQQAVQAWLDSTAQQNNYDNALSCVSYLNSANVQFAADAKAMQAWRDAVWVQCYADMASMTTPPASSAAFIASLPQPAAYGWTVHVTTQV